VAWRPATGNLERKWTETGDGHSGLGLSIFWMQKKLLEYHVFDTPLISFQSKGY